MSMSTQYQPNSLATKLIKRFLVNPDLVIDADMLAAQHDATPGKGNQ